MKKVVTTFELDNDETLKVISSLDVLRTDKLYNTYISKGDDITFISCAGDESRMLEVHHHTIDVAMSYLNDDFCEEDSPKCSLPESRCEYGNFCENVRERYKDLYEYSPVCSAPEPQCECNNVGEESSEPFTSEPQCDCECDNVPEESSETPTTEAPLTELQKPEFKLKVYTNNGTIKIDGDDTITVLTYFDKTGKLTNVANISTDEFLRFIETENAEGLVSKFKSVV